MRAPSVSQQESSKGIINSMTAATQTPAPLDSDVNAKIAFLNFSSDFLAQFSRKAEVLKLGQLAYFLSMAAMDSTETLRTLQAQPDASGLATAALATV
jgi:hypothetical protein